MARKNFSIALILGLTAAAAGCTDEPGDSTETGEGATGDDFGGSGGGGGGGGDGEDNSDIDVQPTYPTQHPRIYLTPNRDRLAQAMAAGTPAATRFRAKVDSWAAGENVWGFEAWNGALLAQVTGDAAYCTKPIAVVEAQVAAAEAKIAANQAPEVAFNSYLHIGELLGDVALVYDWCFEHVTDAQKARWIAYANTSLTNLWNPTQSKWGSATIPWSGWSTHNPSNNYYYSFLRATMLIGLATKDENPQADAWISKFRDEKIYGELVPTFQSDLVGGASREGTGYGVAMRKLYEMYDWWKATTGESLAKKTPHARASMRAFMHQVMPTLDKIAPTGDHARDMTAPFYDYQRDYLQQLISLFPNEEMAGRAQSMLAESSVPAMTTSFMYAYDFINDRPEVAAAPIDGMNTAYYGSGIGEIYARSGWDKAATWVNLIAGPYTESHAHQDQGSIMIYKGGWLAYDANVHSKSGLAQATTAHSLVRIDSGGVPVKQVATTTSKVEALHQGDGYVYAATDLTPAYNGNAAVQKVQREMLYVQPNLVIVYDRVQSAPGTTQTWQLAMPVAPAISGTTATVTNAGHTLAITQIAGGALSTYDFRTSGEFNGGFRLDERMAGGDNRYLHVLGVDGAVASATALGPDGVSINGGAITVTFNRDSVGATLTLNGQTIALGAGVDTLSE